MREGLGKLLVLLVLLGSVGSGLAEDQPENLGDFVLCKNRKIVRTIRVSVEESGACKTVYTKAGQDRVVGSGSRKGSCMGFLKNIHGNLTQAGWKCRDISQTKITTAK